MGWCVNWVPLKHHEIFCGIGLQRRGSSLQSFRCMQVGPGFSAATNARQCEKAPWLLCEESPYILPARKVDTVQEEQFQRNQPPCSVIVRLSALEKWGRQSLGERSLALWGQSGEFAHCPEGCCQDLWEVYFLGPALWQWQHVSFRGDETMTANPAPTQHWGTVDCGRW